MKIPIHDSLFHFVPAGKPADFFYLSAWHPGDRPTDDGANITADESLRSALTDAHKPAGKRKPLPHFRILRSNSGESLAEQGWAVACTESRAIELAAQFRAKTLWKFSADSIAAIDVKARKTVHSATLAEHFLDPRDVRHFTLFVGSPSGSNNLDPLQNAGICTRVGANFPSFTIQRAEGCFQSRFEDALLIHVATRSPNKVLALAHDIRDFLNQDGIGISHNGIYQRVCDWTDDTIILESFNPCRGAMDCPKGETEPNI